MRSRLILTFSLQAPQPRVSYVIPTQLTKFGRSALRERVSEPIAVSLSHAAGRLPACPLARRKMLTLFPIVPQATPTMAPSED